MKPQFKPGKNIAIKVPSHEYQSTLSFYRDVLGFKQKSAESPDAFESVAFEFGDKNLWVDKIDVLSQAEIWLEIEADDIESAKEYLADRVRNEIEPLPEDFKGFWVAGPSNIIHLVTK